MMLRRAATISLTLLLGATLAAPAAASPTDSAEAERRSGGGRLQALHSLRAPVTDENFYFVMADRFENGDTAQRHGRPDRRPPGHRLRPDERGLLQRRRPRRVAGAHRLHRGSRHHVDLADAELQEQAGAARGRAVGRVPRLLDHRLHPDRPAPRHERRAARPHRRRPRAGDEGLLRHHHQPHRRRDRVRGGRPAAVRLEGRRAVPHRQPASRSTTGTTPAPNLPAARSRGLVPVHTRSSTPARRTSRFRPG